MTDIRATYGERYTTVLVPLAERLQSLLEDHLRGVPRIDRISTRPKSIDRFVAKAQKTVSGTPKYDDPLNQIQDQIGSRIVTFYLRDVDRVAEIVRKYLTPIEQKLIEPESEKEFDYVGRHFIFFLPSDLFGEDIAKSAAPEFFELQIKTLFQHSWSEANHDLGYKAKVELTPHQKRRIAYSSAQAWGADQIFDGLYGETVEEEGGSGKRVLPGTNAPTSSVE